MRDPLVGGEGFFSRTDLPGSESAVYVLDGRGFAV
jgi:hypothetical protein